MVKLYMSGYGEETWNIPVRQWTCMYRDFEEKLIWKT